MRMTPSKPNIDSLFPLFYVLRPGGSIIENNRLWLFLLLSFLDVLFLWQPSKEKVPKRKISASDASAKIYGIFNPRRPSRTDVQIGKCSIFDNQFSIFHFSLFTFHLNRRSTSKADEKGEMRLGAGRTWPACMINHGNSGTDSTWAVLHGHRFNIW